MHGTLAPYRPQPAYKSAAAVAVFSRCAHYAPMHSACTIAHTDFTPNILIISYTMHNFVHPENHALMQQHTHS